MEPGQAGEKVPMNKVILSFMIIVVCAVSLGMLQHSGITARKGGKPFILTRERFPVYVVQKTGDVVTFWNEKKVHARIVVHLGKFLHFMKSNASSGRDKSPMQITGETKYADILAGDPYHFHNEPAEYKNYLWVAMQMNIVREIYNVIPSADFMRRFELTDAAAARIDIVEHEFGAPRIITTRIPSISEPVLLNIDASFFASTDPAQFLDTFLKSGLTSDIVTLCLAEDNPDVTEHDRNNLLDFIRLLAEHAEIRNYIPSSGLSTVTK
jgi:hypothetical protein